MSKFKKFAAFAAAMIAAAAVIVGNPQTTKAAAISVQQTGATTQTATIAWTPVAGASYYEVQVTGGGSFKTTGTAASVAKYAGYTGQEFSVTVTAYGYDRKYSANNGYRYLASNYAYCATKPVAVPILTSWKAGTTNPEIKWIQSNYSIPDGYNVQVLDVKGRVIINQTTSSSYYYTFNSSKIKNKGFSVRVQPFFRASGAVNGVVLGDWSAYESYVPQPPVSGTSRRNYYTRKKSVTLNWKKITGAKTYSVYRATSRDGKYKKIATTKKTTISIGNLKTTDYYYYKVVANKVPVKVAGKKKKLNSYTKTFFNYVYD